MDNKYPKNADPRPKRRKDKDNPYTVYSVGSETDNPKYYVEFTDGMGEHIRQEISQELFDTYNQFELDDLSYLNEIDRHYAEGDTETDIDADSTMETVMEHLSVERLREAMAKLPEIQRRRVQMYFFNGLTYQQIAEREDCSKMAVKYSIDVALKFLKENL